MSLNNQFKIKNDSNTLGRILSSNVEITDIFPTNTGLRALTSALLPTSIYQNASGNWQSTYLTVSALSASWSQGGTNLVSVANYLSTNNVIISSLRIIDNLTVVGSISTLNNGTSQQWNTAYSLVTSLTGSGILTSTITTDLSVGGISAAQVLPAGTTFQSFVEQLFIKTFFPTFTAPSIASVASNVGTSTEAGTTGLTVTVTFLSGTINGQTIGGIWNPGIAQNTRSGLLTGGQIFGTQVGSRTAFNTISLASATRIIVDGSNVFPVRVDYEQGPQPKDSKGNNFSTPLPAGNLASNVTVTGFRRAFYASDTLTTRPSSSDQVRSLPGSTNNPGNGTVFTISVPAGTTRVVFAYPGTLQNVTSVWDLGNNQPYVSSFGSPETVSVSGANSFSPISYKVYTYFPSIPFGAPITLTVTI